MALYAHMQPFLLLGVGVHILESKLNEWLTIFDIILKPTSVSHPEYIARE